MIKPDPKLVERVCKALGVEGKTRCARKKLFWLGRCLEEHCPHLKFGPTQRMIHRCRYRKKHYPQGNNLLAELKEKIPEKGFVIVLHISRNETCCTLMWTCNHATHNTESIAAIELTAILQAYDKAFCKEVTSE